MSFKYSTSSYKDFATASTAEKSPRSFILNRPQLRVYKSNSTAPSGPSGGRIRQIILSNKKSINNAVESLKTSLINANGQQNNHEHSLETFSTSYYKMPQIDSNNSTSRNNNDSLLVKAPFKQSKPSTVITQHRISSAKTQTSNYSSIKPINVSQFNATIVKYKFHFFFLFKLKQFIY
jgi:hypothetical protein